MRNWDTLQIANNTKYNNTQLKMTEIIIGDLTNKQHTNAVIKLSIKHNFYTDQIWNMILRKLSPKVNKQLLTAGVSPSKILEMEQQAFANYDNYNWEFRLLMKEGKVVGFSFWDYPKKAGRGVCLEFLLIDEAERGNRYGKLLMDDFIAWADANRPDIKIQFKNTNMLRTFYTKYGFSGASNADGEMTEWFRIMEERKAKQAEN
jgi:predicted GNAT family N-acyltransferase